MNVYRKLPIQIEAMRFSAYTEGFGPQSWNDYQPSALWTWLTEGGCSFAVIADDADPGPAHMLIDTLEGRVRAEVGDWIIKGIKGEFYPCRPDIFAATYEPVDGFKGFLMDPDDQRALRIGRAVLASEAKVSGPGSTPAERGWNQARDTFLAAGDDDE